ncbi:deazaflavin-dependent nitroreductase family protein [Mycolicibacterium fortuitum]|uniref:Deazaflavin-dependent nitroreductase family protein n=1 Tax=Mycolicibacterium fortuitum TaxID=1766 RepID=A0A378UAG2_MYCFO|nr:deazaflavin-dependent nitroreductase family protein [Mycolicibacterium fortuitum]
MSEQMTQPRPPRWLKPMNKVMMAVQRLGLPTGPAMVLTVPGRKTGKPRSTPMTPFHHDGGLYTVAGYPGADWAANARAAGAGTLTRGRRSRPVRIVELPRSSRVRCCGRSRTRSRWVSASPSAAALSSTAPQTNSRNWPGG